MERARSGRVFLMALVMAMALLAGAAQAVVEVSDAQPGAPGMTRAFVDASLRVTPQLESAASLPAREQQVLSAFQGRFKGTWEVRWDHRSDRPNLVQGSGIAVLPGSASGLDAQAFGVAAGAAVELDTAAQALTRFIDEAQPLLRLDGIDLRLDRQRSLPYGEGRTHWFVQFAQYHDGVRVEGAYAFFRVSHGNLVQFGSQRVAEVGIDVTPALSREAAWDAAVAQLQLEPGARIEEIIEPGERVLYPVSADGAGAGTAFRGAAGSGYAHRLVWRYVYRLAGIRATYELLFDAHANRILEVRDRNAYADATVEGGVFLTTNTEPEVVMPLPYVGVRQGSAPGTETFTDLLGRYDYTGGTASAALAGKYVTMRDECGASALTSSTDGHLDFGTSPGTDCATSGVGGTGNTRAARTGYYHLNQINETARRYLPDNAWLQQPLDAVVNINAACNAYWDGWGVNFYRSSARCANTGEILGVFLHEWGHGMDENGGGPFVMEYGSGEAVGDTFAVLSTRNACVGPGFFTGPNSICHNCTTCTGVRDTSVFARGTARPIASPANVTAAKGMNCGRLLGQGGVTCPYIHPQMGVPYEGVMGYEGHCESLIASSANWDLTQALVRRYGEDAGYAQMEKIWYGSLASKGSAYQITAGGQCNVNASVDGCGADNWYTVFLAVDDDDGDLANGTPNACRIWDAMNAHGIACGQRPACTADADALFADGFEGADPPEAAGR